MKKYISLIVIVVILVGYGIVSSVIRERDQISREEDNQTGVALGLFPNPIDIPAEYIEVDNKYYYVAVSSSDGMQLFVLQTLNPDDNVVNYLVTPRFNKSGFIEDDKMIFVDEVGSYQKRVKELVGVLNKKRDSTEQISYTSVINEIHEKVEQAQRMISNFP